MPVVLYGCETCFIALRKERRLREFENRTLSENLGPKNENRAWGRLQYNCLFRPPNIVKVIKFRRLRLIGHVARIEKARSAIQILTHKPTGRRHLGRPKRR